MAGGQQRDFHAQGTGRLERPGAVHAPVQTAAGRLQQLLGPLGGLAAGGVGVEKRDDLVAVPAQHGQLRRGERGAERGHGLGEPVLMRHEAIDITLDDQRSVPLPDGVAGEVGGVEQAALAVERGLGRIQVLGLLVAEAPAAEGDHAPLQIADGEQQTAAEAIVDARTVLARDDEPGRDQRVFGYALRLQRPQQHVPALGSPAQSEAPGDLGLDAALVEIGAGTLAARGPQALGVEAGRQIHHAEQLFAARIGRPGSTVLGQRHVGLLGQCAHRLGEREAVLAHEEAEGVAAHAAAEAVEDALLGIDHEGGRLLAVEGTEALPVLSGLLQIHEAADDFDDVHPGPDLVEQSRRVGRHQETLISATVAPAPPSAGPPSRKDSTSG